MRENIADEMKRLKQQKGKDMVIFGGAEIASCFMDPGLIDEYRIIVNPVVLGKGKPLFPELQNPQKPELLKTRKMDSGNAILLPSCRKDTPLTRVTSSNYISCKGRKP